MSGPYREPGSPAGYGGRDSARGHCDSSSGPGVRGDMLDSAELCADCAVALAKEVGVW